MWVVQWGSLLFDIRRLDTFQMAVGYWAVLASLVVVVVGTFVVFLRRRRL